MCPVSSKGDLGSPVLSNKPRGQRAFYAQGLIINILGFAGYVVFVAYELIFFITPEKGKKNILSSWDHIPQRANP